ncbi:MAG: hypothetical protein ACXWLM_02660 [Myxococcales bacterium]
MSAALAALSLLACAKGQNTAHPAVVVYQTASGVTRLHAVPETPGSTAVALTPADQRVAFCGAIGGTSVVYALVGDDASVSGLHQVNLDGTGDVPLASVAPATWTSPGGAWRTADGTIVVQLSRLDGGGPELLAISGGAVTSLALGRFAALSGNRIAYLANATSAASVGDVRTVGSDGSANLALGGGDGDDELHGFVEGKLVFTAHHSQAAPELRIAALDGAGVLSRAGSKGLLLSGSTVVAERAGGFEKVGVDLYVKPVSLLGGAQVLALLADGRVAAFVKGAGVMADGQVLDSFTADTVVAPHAFADRLVYTANNFTGAYLRSARLDAGGAVTLSEGHGQELLFESELPGNQVLFYRTKATEPGGWLSTVALGGGGEKVVGDDLTGTRKAADQDFGGVTKAGRLVFEAELTEGQAPGLFIVEPGGGVRSLTAAGTAATLSAVVESAAP